MRGSFQNFNCKLAWCTVGDSVGCVVLIGEPAGDSVGEPVGIQPGTWSGIRSGIWSASQSVYSRGLCGVLVGEPVGNPVVSEHSSRGPGRHTVGDSVAEPVAHIQAQPMSVCCPLGFRWSLLLEPSQRSTPTASPLRLMMLALSPMIGHWPL